MKEKLTGMYSKHFPDHGPGFGTDLLLVRNWKKKKKKKKMQIETKTTAILAWAHRPHDAKLQVKE